MANLITTTEELTGIADKIRSKTGETDLLEYPDDFKEAIDELEKIVPSATGVSF